MRHAVTSKAKRIDDDACEATLGEIAEELGVTSERVRQIQNIALKKLAASGAFDEFAPICTQRKITQ